MKKIQLGIPQPCHENWNNMKPEEKGRFCHSCQKTVMDFREMSDRQLAEFFKKPAGSVCGRFNTDQLNRDIQIPRKHIPWVKYFFQFSLPAFLFSMKAGAQGRVVVQEKTFVQEKTGFDSEIIAKPIQKGNKEVNINRDSISVNGKITDESGVPIGQVTVMIKGSNSGVVADNEGNFRLNCKKGDVLQISCIGYEKQEIKADRSNLNISLLQSMMVTLGMIVYIQDFEEPKKEKRKPFIAKIIDSTKRILKIFPNPVSTGEVIRIDVSQLGKGDYQVKIVSSDGVLIRSRHYKHQKENNSIEESSNGLRAGNYYIHLVNNKTGKIFTEKIIVQ